VRQSYRHVVFQALRKPAPKLRQRDCARRRRFLTVSVPAASIPASGQRCGRSWERVPACPSFARSHVHAEPLVAAPRPRQGCLDLSIGEPAGRWIWVPRIVVAQIRLARAEKGTRALSSSSRSREGSVEDGGQQGVKLGGGVGLQVSW